MSDAGSVGGTSTTAAPTDDDLADGAPIVEHGAPSRASRLGFASPVRVWRESAFVVLVVGPLVTFVYKLYDAHWHVPFNYTADGLQTSAYTKSIIDNGWYFSIPRLGAPFTADWRDFPLGGENVHWLSLKVLGVFTGDYALSINAYFVLSFFLIALVTYFVARYLGFSVPTALVVGVLYAFLPFHAYRNTAHLVRSVYYAVPLAVLVLLWAANYRTELFREDENGRLRIRRGRMGCTLAIGVLVGSSDTQNAAFLASILAVIVLAAVVRDRDWRPVVVLALVGAATGGTLIANDAPFLYARVERGANTVAGNRPLSDQDYYGLRPANLVLPAPDHRVPALRKLTEKSDTAKFTNSETPGTALGVVGAFGFLASLIAALGQALGGRSPAGPRARFLAQLGLLNLASLLIGVIGGFAFFLALFGFGNYRTWNRISLFIACFSLFAAGVGLEWLFRWVRTRFRARYIGLIVAAALAIVIAVGGSFDQTTPQFIPNYKLTATRFDTDASFYHQLEKMLPKRAMVFQLPFEPFPEAGTIAGMTDYEDLTGYLHTKDLRFNYGGMKGRPEGDWEQNLSIYEPVAMVGSIAAVGFQGVVVDRTGFTDNAKGLLAAIQPFVGDVQLRSTDDRLLYLDLTALRARLQREIGDDALQQDRRVTLGDDMHWDGFSFPEPSCAGTRRWATSRTASIELDNEAKTPVTISAATSLEANPKATRIDVSAPGSARQAVHLSDGKGVWEQTVTLQPGKNVISFSLDGPQVEAPLDARTLQFALVGASFGQAYDSPVLDWAHRQQAGCASG